MRFVLVLAIFFIINGVLARDYKNYQRRESRAIITNGLDTKNSIYKDPQEYYQVLRDSNNDNVDSNNNGFIDFLRDLFISRDNKINNDSRKGRKRGWNSHEQGIMLVEALGQKQNFTAMANGHRGHHRPELHNGIMEMLGRSNFFIFFFFFIIKMTEIFILLTTQLTR